MRQRSKKNQLMADSKQNSLENSLESTGSASSKSSFKSLSSSSDSQGYTKSEWISKNVAQAMLWSDFGLSLFESPLNRQQAEVVCTRLIDLNCKITAIWVVARPLNYNNDGKFQHWAIKLQAPPSLISLDFLEVKQYGYIRYEETVASNVELKDFLFYYYNDKKQCAQKRKKWKILASVTPSPLHDTSYLKYLDQYDVETLKIYMKQQRKDRNKKKRKNNINNNNNDEKCDPLLKEINCKKRVCDIADFISMWTQNVDHKKKQKSSSNMENDVRGYHPIISNCQQFVADLFHWLVGSQVMYFYCFLHMYIILNIYIFHY